VCLYPSFVFPFSRESRTLDPSIAVQVLRVVFVCVLTSLMSLHYYCSFTLLLYCYIFTTNKALPTLDAIPLSLFVFLLHDRPVVRLRDGVCATAASLFTFSCLSLLLVTYCVNVCCLLVLYVHKIQHFAAISQNYRSRRMRMHKLIFYRGKAHIVF